MRFLTVRYEGQQRVAIEAESDPHQLGFLPPAFSLLLDVIDAGDEVPAPVEWAVFDDVQLLAPIPCPRRNILCVGMNYCEHSIEFSQSGFDTSATTTSPTTGTSNDDTRRGPWRDNRSAAARNVAGRLRG